MSADKPKTSDYQTLSSNGRKRGGSSQNASSRSAPHTSRADVSLSRPRNNQDHHETDDPQRLSPTPDSNDVRHSQSLTNPYKKQNNGISSVPETAVSEPKLSERTKPVETEFYEAVPATPESAEIPYSEQHKIRRREKFEAADKQLLQSDNWLVRNGHTLSFVGLFLFSVLVLVRPYEQISALSFLSSTAFYFAVATILIYIPSQLATEGSLTAMSNEVKAVLILGAIAVVTMPIAKDPPTAWEVFNDSFSKAVLMFIVMINVLRTRARLTTMLWLSLGVGVILSWQALGMFIRGDLRSEGYRVDVEIGGMFGNPNDLSLHLVTMIPIAVGLGLGTRRTWMRVIYFGMAALLASANFVTYSRGGFLGLVAASALMIWKIGRRNRLQVSILSGIVGLLVILFAPGNYGLRILSIFGLAPDEVGSRDQRRELLERSILVSLRNPWGIGIGNFPIVGVQNLVTHNAYTQVSSELGLLGLAAYLWFMISPFRKLSAIERTQFKDEKTDWFYYLAIGLQGSILAYMVSSFFVSVAYNWFIYYLIAYAVAFRRIYQIEHGNKEEPEATPLHQMFGFENAGKNG